MDQYNCGKTHFEDNLHITEQTTRVLHHIPTNTFVVYDVFISGSFIHFHIPIVILSRFQCLFFSVFTILVRSHDHWSKQEICQNGG